jgi:hypothetical protein
MKTWLIGLGGIALVWLLAWVTTTAVGKVAPSPDRVLRILREIPLPPNGSPQRTAYIDKVARELNRLDFAQRRQLRAEEELDRFFRDLTRDEQERFLAITLPEGFRQMMSAFNRMEPEQRRRWVDRALNDLAAAEERGEAGPPPELDEEITRLVVNEGLQAFYEEASAETKLDFAPVLERIQESLQRFR